MGAEELIENLVWSATFTQRTRLRVMHDAHQAARRKLAFRYGKAFTEMERLAPLYAIGRDIARGLIKGREVRLFQLMTREASWARPCSVAGESNDPVHAPYPTQRLTRH